MIAYKKLESNDKTELLNFLKQADSLFPIPLSSKQNLESLGEKLLSAGKVIGAYSDDKLAGVICGYTNDSKECLAYISVLCVLPEFQEKSIAKRLLEKFISESRQAGMKNVFLYTHNSNRKAIKLYQKFGFESVESDRTGDIKLICEL